MFTRGSYEVMQSKCRLCRNHGLKSFPSRFSEQQEIERLYAAALRVSKSRFKEVIEEEAYRLMPFEKIYELISADDLNVDEEKVSELIFLFYLHSHVFLLQYHLDIFILVYIDLCIFYINSNCGLLIIPFGRLCMKL